MSSTLLKPGESLALAPRQVAIAPSGDRGRWSGWLVWISALLLVFVVSWNGWVAYQRHQRARALRCDEPIYMFGQGFVGDQFDHTFRVTNVSRQPVQIEKVVASCGCTTVATGLKGKSIEPGASFEVPVRLTLSATEKGEFVRPVVVRFAGEPKLQLTLKVKGEVRNRWSWSTTNVVFDKVPTGEAATRTIELVRHPDAPQEEPPNVLVPLKNLLKVDVGEGVATDRGIVHQVTISALPPVPMGRTESLLYANTVEGLTPLPPVRVILVRE